MALDPSGQHAYRWWDGLRRPDPAGVHEYRWWDGAEWTDQVADGGATSTDTMPGDDVAGEKEADVAAHGTPATQPSSWIAGKGARVATVAVLLVVRFAVGSAITWAAMRGELDDERSALADLQAELDDTSTELEEVRDALDDREARRRADEAEAARIEAERERAERETADAERRAAEEQAAAEAAAAAERREIPRDGTYEVGRDIDPGRWRTGGGGSCYWAILSEPSGALGSIITNSFGGGPQIADLAEGQYFETSGCGTWAID